MKGVIAGFSILEPAETGGGRRKTNALAWHPGKPCVFPSVPRELFGHVMQQNCQAQQNFVLHAGPEQGL